MGTHPLMYTTSSGSTVSVVPDAESLAVAAAGIIVAAARDAARKGGRFTVALSGGATPGPVYRLLAGPPLMGLVPWDATHVFWGDERCVEPGDPRSNEGTARSTLLDHVSIPAESIHPMRCAGPEGGTDPAQNEAAARRAARDYEEVLRGFFGTGPAGLDLVLLGLGSDGHTASLFPGSDVLDEQERWVVSSLESSVAAPVFGGVGNGTGELLWRVTLTAPFINRAGLILFLVSGASKAAAVEVAIEGDPDPRKLPAVLMRPAGGRVHWLLDEGAASGLRGPFSGRPATAGPPGPVEEYEDLPGCGLGFSR